MTEDDARAWIGARFGAAAVDTLTRYVALVTGEASGQNLVAPSTLPVFWTRHVLDSAQLVPLAREDGVWLDVGSGAGLPGLVVAILRDQPTILTEPRRQRAAFLERCAVSLGLSNVEVRSMKVEALSRAAAVISARAVGPVENLLQAASGCATVDTRWLLPRGRFGSSDISQLQRRWRGMFHMKQSLTNPESTILIADGVMRR